jgi:hypothetical protein
VFFEIYNPKKRSGKMSSELTPERVRDVIHRRMAMLCDQLVSRVGPREAVSVLLGSAVYVLRQHFGREFAMEHLLKTAEAVREDQEWPGEPLGHA